MKVFFAAAVATFVAATLFFAAGRVDVAHAETLRAEGGSAAGLSALVPQLLSKYAAPDLEIRVNVDQTLTRAALKVATGAIDMASTPAGAFSRMQGGQGALQGSGAGGDRRIKEYPRAVFVSWRAYPCHDL